MNLIVPAADPDFYWLGRVPCRTVLFFGMVVGVQTYEQRTVYSGEHWRIPSVLHAEGAHSGRRVRHDRV